MGLCIFGFLLTVLAIIIQSDTNTISWLKSDKKLYQRFIAFNKKTVILSFLLSFYSFVIGSIDIGIFNDSETHLFPAFDKILCSFWLGVLFWLIRDSLYFMHTFYLLVKES